MQALFRSVELGHHVNAMNSLPIPRVTRACHSSRERQASPPAEITVVYLRRFQQMPGLGVIEALASDAGDGNETLAGALSVNVKTDQKPTPIVGAHCENLPRSR